MNEKHWIFRKEMKYVLLSLILFPLIIIIVNSPCSDVLAQSEEPEFWVIIVGVLGTSSEGGFTDQCAEAAKKLDQVLRHVYGDGHTILLTDEDATKTAVLDAIDYISSMDSAGDTLLFYYTGHSISRGMYMYTYIPLIRISYYDQLALDPQKMITPGDLNDALGKLSSDKIYVVLDMCDAGGFGEKLLDERITVLCSSSVGKTSWVSRDIGSSIFTHFFLEEVDRYIKEPQGRLTIEEIYDNIGVNIESFFSDEYGGYYEEVPQLIDNDSEDACILERLYIDCNSPPPFFDPLFVIDGLKYMQIPKHITWAPRTFHTIEFPFRIDIPGGDSYMFVSFDGNNSPKQRITAGYHRLEYVLLPNSDVWSQFKTYTEELWYGQPWFLSIYTS